jgi:hypothetical protein
MSEEQEAPKLHVDSDWKAEAQAEKDRLAADEEASKEVDVAGEGGDESGDGMGGIPPASFETLISTMATQCLLALGMIADPSTGQRYLHPDLARHHIDMLTVLNEKTEGNLSKEETELLGGTLYELRQRYIDTINAQRDSGR